MSETSRATLPASAVETRRRAGREGRASPGTRRAPRAAGERGLSKGERTREAILSTAVQLASEEGLEGLTIGRLAAALEMSKSGLYAHFGSKLDLQLATVETARGIFIDEVLRPSLAVPRGVRRLEALCDEWLSYAERRVFRGGCFFVATSVEFDSRPGRVRDRIAAIMREWLGALERAVAEAQREGHLGGACSPAQLAFEINALVMGANWHFQLYDDTGAFQRARTAVRERLERVA